MPVNKYVNTGQSAGEECSSGGGGRGLEFEESVLYHPYHSDEMVDGKDPVCVGDVVGVSLIGAAADTDMISVDTEGIFWLNVLGSVSDDSDDGVAEELPAETQIYIKRAGGTVGAPYVLSGQSDPVAWQPFGHTLGVVAAHLTTPTLVAVKVHREPTIGETIQIGLSSAMWESDKDGHSFISLRADASSATGDHRLIYAALTLSGGGPGEALRGRTIVTAETPGGVHGGHLGLEYGAAGSTPGLGTGGRLTLLHKNAAHVGGTIAGGMSELYAEGALTDYAGATEHSIHRFVNDGQATGKATAVNVWSFAGLSANQLSNHSNWVAGLSKVLTCVIDGVTYYFAASTNK